MVNDSPIDVSVVSGTYNRLNNLMDMVESVRISIGDMASYEIILVDGGSTDGTIEWCKNQPDVVLIKQGKLLGAVKAFNAGAEAANGRYVVLANDDIVFIDYSLLKSLSFMDDHLDVGMGCFYQDRDGMDWHVSRMIAVDPEGNICTVHYGQVCIVPRWLGDELGWWGDYLHTYGGDNELSCNVWESGYAVAAMEGAMISDLKAEDELRGINNAVDVMTGTHKDTLAWKKRWPNGTYIIEKPVKQNSLARRMRIMYFPLMEANNNLQRLTKRGLRDALQNKGTVLQYDYVAKGWSDAILQADAWKPDLFVFQIQDANAFEVVMLKQLRMSFPQALFVNWNGDYNPDNLFNARYMDVLRQFNMSGFVTTSVRERYDAAGINWFYWQIGYELSDAEPLDDTPAHDVIFLGNCYSKQRLKLGKFMQEQAQGGVDVGLYGFWPNGWSSGQNLYDFDDGARLYKNAKIAISTQQYTEAYGFVSNRIFQSMAAGGCAVLQQKFDGMEELLGLEDNKHLLVWETYEELEDYIALLLRDSRKRESIAKCGNEFVLKNHSFDSRVNELWRVLYI